MMNKCLSLAGRCVLALSLLFTPFTNAQPVLTINNNTPTVSSPPIIAHPDLNAPALLWKFATNGAIYSSAVIKGDQLYFGSDDMNLYVLNKNSGQLSWKFKTKGEIKSAPVVNENKVIFSSTDGHVYAADKDKGKLMWTFKTRGEQRYDLWDYYISAPVIADQVVYFGSGDSSVYAITENTGKLIWSYKTNGIVHASPVIKDGVLYVGSYDGSLYALNAATGKLIWTFKTVGDVYFPKGEIQKAVLVQDSTVYFGSRDYNIYALNAKTGTGKWNMKEKGSWIIATPFLHHNTLFFGTSDTHRFYAMDANSADIKWTLPLNMRVYGEAIIADGNLVFGCFNGKLYFVDPDSGKIRSVFQTEESKKRYAMIYNDKDQIRSDVQLYGDDTSGAEKKILSLGSILSTPLVQDHTIYFGDTNGFFYAVSTGIN